MKQRYPKTIQKSNQKCIHYSDTYINGETQTFTNKLHNKFHVTDIKFLRGTGKKIRKRHNLNGTSPAAVTQNLLTF